MKSNVVIGVVVAALVVIGGVYYFYAKPGSESAQQATGGQNTTGGQQQTTTGPNGTPGKFSGSMSALAARGGEWKCTVDTSTDQSVSSGIVYVSGGKMSANFTSTVSGFGEIMSYMISDGSYVYTWSTAMPTGMKMPVSKKGTTAAGTSGQGAIDDTNSYSYTCEKWSVNPTVFVPPSTVTFKELGA